MGTHYRPERRMFPRLDLRNLSQITTISQYYEDGFITRSQQNKIESLRAAQAAQHFAVSQFGQVRVFSETHVWCVDNAGQVVFTARRPK